MDEITVNEMKAILKIFKDFKTRYNANNLSKKLDLTSMGTLKILRRLYQKNILKLEELGKAKYYSINYDNPFAIDYIVFLLQKEANESLPRVKRWLNEAKKIEKLLNNESLREKLSNNARKTVAYSFSWERSINKIKRILLE